MKKSTIYIALFTLMTAVVFTTGCKKDDDNNNNNYNGKASVKVNFSLTNGGTAYTVKANDNTNYINVADPNNSSVTFRAWVKELKFYISKIALVNHDGDSTFINQTDLLAWSDTTTSKTFDLGLVDPNHYHFLVFYLGVDSVDNHADPTSQPTTSALNLGYPGADDMHWSWASGYRFLLMEGQSDTTGGATPTFNQSFTYHIGGDMMKRTISVPLDFEAEPNTDGVVNIKFDVHQLFYNLDLKTDTSTHTMDNMPLAAKVANNAEVAFSGE